MARRRRPTRTGGTTTEATATVPEVPARQPCPCGSGKRYKNCHGAREDAVVTVPFAGRADEADWIAMRELVPSATAPLTLAEPTDRSVTVATVLPMALPAIVRSDGRVLVGLQVHGRSGDVSRDIAHTIEQALAAEPGAMLSSTGLPGPGPRLQDMLDPTPIEVTVHEDFSFWLEGGDDETSTQVRASLEQANAAITPTSRLSSVQGAYWCDAEDKAHLRWVMPHEEDATLNALARLMAAGQLGLGPASRYVGSFRAHGRLVPVWDLPQGTPATEWEEPAAEFEKRFTEALATADALSADERRAREGLRGRQFTLR